MKNIALGQEEVYSCVWSPDGTHIASGASDGSLHVWEVRRALPLRTLVDLNEAESPPKSEVQEAVYVIRNTPPPFSSQ